MSEISVKITADTTEYDAMVAQSEARLRQLNADIHQTERNMEQVVRSSWSAITATVMAARSMASALGQAFPPIFDAIFTAITQTIYSLQAIAAAYAAGVVTAPMTLVLEMAAISLSVAAIGYTAIGQQKVAADLQRMNSALRGWGSASTQYGRIHSAWLNT